MEFGGAYSKVPIIRSLVLILEEKSHLHELIWTYTFINFEKIFSSTRLFYSTRTHLIISEKKYKFLMKTCMNLKVFRLKTKILSKPKQMMHRYLILKYPILLRIRNFLPYMFIIFALHDYWFWGQMSTYMFIPHYTCRLFGTLEYWSYYTYCCFKKNVGRIFCIWWKKSLG